jgi:hypothetical protein
MKVKISFNIFNSLNLFQTSGIYINVQSISVLSEASLSILLFR